MLCASQNEYKRKACAMCIDSSNAILTIYFHPMLYLPFALMSFSRLRLMLTRRFAIRQAQLLVVVGYIVYHMINLRNSRIHIFLF